MSEIALAVLGGTGVYHLAALGKVETFDGNTVYGHPSGSLHVGRVANKRVAFMARHGENHAIPPHKVNYRANLRRLKDVGIKRVVAINAVGGIGEQFGPRTIAVPDQIIDYTWGRISTLSEEPGSKVLHVDFGDPYTESLRQALMTAAKRAGVVVKEGGCYGATQGPRLETRAEIARMRRDGCDMVGMTGMPEAGLARELGLEYASLALVANWAAGCGASAEQAASEITLEEVLANIQATTELLPRLLNALLA